MTEKTTSYDPTTSREPRPGERSSSPSGVGGGTGSAGTAGYGREEPEAGERERARRAAEEIKTAAREAAASTAGAVRNRLSGELDYRKYRSGQRLGRVAQALREGGTTVSTEDELIGRYMERAADRVERLAQYLDQKDVNEILHDAREVARRRPELFVGSLFVAGLLLGRFLRSSAPDAGPRDGRDHESGPSDAGSFGRAGFTGSYRGTGPSPIPTSTDGPLS